MGAVLAVTSLGGLVFFIGIQLFQIQPSPYIGMLIYVALPLLLVTGLLLIPVGTLWEARRRAAAARRGSAMPAPLQLDFGNPRHLLGVLIFAGITVVILATLGATGYGAVEFMDSPGFCGGLCHTVMEPQYEPYKRSAHREVECVACHIGPGADWYVQSKLSGVRQLVAVVIDSYPRPIPAPIENLRPARDTCEECHHREQAYDLILRIYRSYLPDENNTTHVRALAFRVGTGGSQFEDAGGVHWHTSAELWYQTADHERQIIGAVEVKTTDGVEEWVNPEVATEDLLEPRLMDCIDCHNRTAHKIPSPNELIDEALADGRLSADLPFLKREALRLLNVYEEDLTFQELQARWSQEDWFEQLWDFYEVTYPQVATSEQGTIQTTMDELKRISDTVYYPDMNTSWLTYPENRGHPDDSGRNVGCFRCHTTLVKVDSGELLAGGQGGSGCLACHGLDEEEALLDDPLNDPSCAYCHVSVPIEMLERPPIE
jgi:nitrate/TMAO reductase-like tetraheme cytochrome c subunit